MPTYILHGFLTGYSSNVNPSRIFSDIEKLHTLTLLQSECKHVNITWDSIFAVTADGKVSLLAGFPSPSTILDTGWSDGVPSQGILLQITESWTHRFCLISSGSVFGSHKASSEWKLVQSESGDKEQYQCICAGDNHTVGITDQNHGRVIAPSKDLCSFVSRPLCPGVNLRSVSCGKEHVILLTSIGVVLTYGNGSRGQLGHGSIDDVDSPQIVEELEGMSVVAIAAGGWHSAAVSDIGDVYTWGWNESGQLGFPCRKIRESMGETPADEDCVNVQCFPCVVDLPLTSDEVKVTDVSCGSRHTAILTDDGQLYTWGWNKYGQLGHGDIVDRDTPTRVHYGKKFPKFTCDETRTNTSASQIESLNKSDTKTEDYNKMSEILSTKALASTHNSSHQKDSAVSSTEMDHEGDKAVKTLKNSVTGAIDRDQELINCASDSDNVFLSRSSGPRGLGIGGEKEQVLGQTESASTRVELTGDFTGQIEMKDGFTKLTKRKIVDKDIKALKMVRSGGKDMNPIQLKSDICIGKEESSCIREQRDEEDESKICYMSENSGNCAETYVVKKVYCGGWSTLVELAE